MEREWKERWIFWCGRRQVVGVWSARHGRFFFFSWAEFRVCLTVAALEKRIAERLRRRLEEQEGTA